MIELMRRPIYGFDVVVYDRQVKGLVDELVKVAEGTVI
jgi:hypothetical protein